MMLMVLTFAPFSLRTNSVGVSWFLARVLIPVTVAFMTSFGCRFSSVVHLTTFGSVGCNVMKMVSSFCCPSTISGVTSVSWLRIAWWRLPGFQGVPSGSGQVPWNMGYSGNQVAVAKLVTLVVKQAGRCSCIFVFPLLGL